MVAVGEMDALDAKVRAARSWPSPWDNVGNGGGGEVSDVRAGVRKLLAVETELQVVWVRAVHEPCAPDHEVVDPLVVRPVLATRRNRKLPVALRVVPGDLQVP